MREKKDLCATVRMNAAHTASQVDWVKAVSRPLNPPLAMPDAPALFHDRGVPRCHTPD
jgi:hypothetical protein